jgi:hypothetical protein
MSNKKQTAVEWLQDQFHKDNLSKEFAKVFNSSFEQAKEMEKQQIIDAWDSAYGGDNNHDGEQYYNENYEI